MGCHVTVVTASGERHEFELHDADFAGLDARQAQEWLGQEFEAAGCVPTNPVGKLLLADKILCLAKAQQEAAWAEPIALGEAVRARRRRGHRPRRCSPSTSAAIPSATEPGRQKMNGGRSPRPSPPPTGGSCEPLPCLLDGGGLWRHSVGWVNVHCGVNRSAEQAARRPTSSRAAALPQRT
jgi:hypothetical protein